MALKFKRYSVLIFSYFLAPLCRHTVLSFFIHKSLSRNLLLCFVLCTFFTLFFLSHFFIRKDLEAKINISMFVFLSTPSFFCLCTLQFFFVYFYFITFHENLNGENILRIPVGLQDDFLFQLKFFLLCTLHFITNYGILLHLFNSIYFKSAKVTEEST